MRLCILFMHLCAYFEYFYVLFNLFYAYLVLAFQKKMLYSVTIRSHAALRKQNRQVYLQRTVFLKLYGEKHTFTKGKPCRGGFANAGSE